MMMGIMNEISLEDVSKLEPGQIMVDSIRQWRSDCQAGQFKIGATTMKGSKLDMELVGAQVSEGEYFGYSALLQVVEFLKFANYFQLVENIDKDILSILDSKNTKSTTCKRALYSNPIRIV